MVLVIYETSAMEHFRFLKVTLFLIFNLDYGITISNLMQLAEKFCISQGAKFVTIGKAKFQFKISPQYSEFVFEFVFFLKWVIASQNNDNYLQI